MPLAIFDLDNTLIDRTGPFRRWADLDHHADAIAVSEEVGAAKPDPRVFEAAARRCGARLNGGGWMVGDCPTRDIAGGHGVGLRTAWMRRGRGS